MGHFKIGQLSGAIIAAGALVLQSCSGGSSNNSGPNMPVPPSNRAPVLTSDTAASVAENTSGTVYTATATDADGDTLSFAISGGDAGQLRIDASTGEVSFAAPPDFEAPTDGDGDNAYDFTLTVSDPSGASADQMVTLTVTDVTETGQRYLDPVFANLDVDRGVTFAPGIAMDIYRPTGDTVTDRPVMIVASGGGFVDQDRENVEPIAETFARLGYVGATIDYRVLGGAPLDADELAVAGIMATHDMFAAVRFFRADAESANTYGTRPDAIFVSGESAGGVMAAIAATLDPSDTVSSAAVSAYLAANGGTFGDVGNNPGTASTVNGAMPLSGAVLDLSAVDANSAVLYAAHEEFDPVVPCGTEPEGASFTGLVVSGACDLVPAYGTAGATAELFLVAGSAGHVNFTDQQRTDIYSAAATLFFTTVISP